MIWLLRKELYGLRTSPRLWYKDLASTLRRLGFESIPGYECLFIGNGLLIFFYVDDIVALAHPTKLKELRKFEDNLMKAYNIRKMGELHWFLGIRVIRDRSQGKIWLCQDSLIDKIVKRFKLSTSKAPSSPLPTQDLLPHTGKPLSPETINAYQLRVGSIGYAAITTRPDVAKAHSKLAEHLQNPSKHHLEMANRVIHYLNGTKYLSIEYSAESA